MAEEQRYEQSNAQALCANNCGFFGNPTTLNLCSKCYRDHRLKEQQHQEMESLWTSTASVKPAPPSLFSSSSSPATASVQTPVAEISPASVSSPAEPPPSGCGACRKRVGLTGFKCRCGTTYCGVHSYAERHACTFDFKALGKEAIAKANPVVKAAKLDHKILATWSVWAPLDLQGLVDDDGLAYELRQRFAVLDWACYDLIGPGPMV